ncbi:MAG TPA: hypothetical protein VJ777_20990 [Mycobacterium sp.]|nr:hypothetical protein [Mycobacterium sp.]
MRRMLWVDGIGAVLVLAAVVGCSSVKSEPQATAPSCGGEVGRVPFYSTSFQLDELPISESGAWSHTGRSWTFVQTENGFAHGTQTGQGGYDDSYAYLSGFPPDQQACAQIHRGSPAGFQEVEILLRWSDSENSARGYECFIHHSGQYAKIVRWNGPYGDFTTIANVGNVTAPQDGDTVRATAIGSVISLYLNDQMLAQAIDSTYSTGNPGMGFFKDNDGRANTEFGFVSYAATGL